MPKPAQLWLLLLPVMLAVPLWFAKRARENSTAYILFKYAQMGPNAIQLEHVQVRQYQSNPNAVMLRTTWFPTHFSQGTCAPASAVFRDGNAEAWVDACGNTNRHPTRRVSIDQLFAILRHLPPTPGPVPQKQAVILSYCVDNTCTSRVYDHTNPPTEVREVFRLTGAPLE